MTLALMADEERAATLLDAEDHAKLLHPSSSRTLLIARPRREGEAKEALAALEDDSDDDSDNDAGAAKKDALVAREEDASALSRRLNAVRLTGRDEAIPDRGPPRGHPRHPQAPPSPARAMRAWAIVAAAAQLAIGITPAQHHRAIREIRASAQTALEGVGRRYRRDQSAGEACRRDSVELLRASRSVRRRRS